MPPQTPRLEEVFEGAIDDALERAFVAKPARVVSFDATNFTISAQVTQKQIYTREDGTSYAATLPVIPNVPLVFPGSGPDTGMTFPIAAGDAVLLIFADDPLDAWKFTSDKIVAPKVGGKHGLSNAIAIPGLRSMVGAAATSMSPVPDDAFVIWVKDTLELRLGHGSASKKVAHVPGVQDALKGALSDPTIAAAIVAVGLPGGPAALVTAVNTYFGTNPVSGADRVKVE